VADSKNHRVQKLSPSGEALASWGGEGSEPGKFKDPCGIAVGPDGSVYVADTWNHRIQKFDANGTFLAQWAEESPGLWGPRGIAVSADGTVYVTDTGNKRVLAYSPTGERLHVWGQEGSADGELIEPVGIDVNDQGEVVVADTGNRRIQFFSATGQFLRQWRVRGWEDFYTEPYLATAGADVYVTDSGQHRFARYRDGNLQATWGKTGKGSGELNRPIGIAAAGSGMVYVADTMNHRIQRFVVE
jgi:DNA-binding beta-propeller fold protein YncE